jgi:hypothetical protein
MARDAALNPSLAASPSGGSFVCAFPAGKLTLALLHSFFENWATNLF